MRHASGVLQISGFVRLLSTSVYDRPCGVSMGQARAAATSSHFFIRHALPMMMRASSFHLGCILASLCMQSCPEPQMQLHPDRGFCLICCECDSSIPCIKSLPMNAAHPYRCSQTHIGTTLRRARRMPPREAPGSSAMAPSGKATLQLSCSQPLFELSLFYLKDNHVHTLSRPPMPTNMIWLPPYLLDWTPACCPLH